LRYPNLRKIPTGMERGTTKEEGQETVVLALQITHVVEPEETMEIIEAPTGIVVELVTTTITTTTIDNRGGVTCTSQGGPHPRGVDLATTIAQETAATIVTTVEEGVAHTHRAVIVVE